MAQIGIGGAVIDRIEESVYTDFKAATFFSEWSPEIVEQHRSWMVPGHYDEQRGNLKLTFKSWCIPRGGYTILVETCVGNDKRSEDHLAWHMKSWPYLERLAAAGVKPEEIDFVLCTHLHVDHIGWNTKRENGRWVPTFPKARYIFSKKEFDHYNAIYSKKPADRPSFEDSVLPVVAAGRAEMVSGNHKIGDTVLIEPAPGHTPGHITIKLEDDEERAIFTGDILHHAIQVYHPQWNSEFCADQDQARATRRRVLEYCTESGALMMPAHFGPSYACHIVERGDSFTPRFWRA